MTQQTCGVGHRIRRDELTSAAALAPSAGGGVGRAAASVVGPSAAQIRRRGVAASLRRIEWQVSKDFMEVSEAPASG
jgi:hypothetical protein